MYTKQQIQSLNQDIKKFPNVHPISKSMKNHREGIARMVMLDRYAFKDLEQKTLKEGDLVLLTVLEDTKFPTRGIGTIRKILLEDKKAVIHLENEYTSYGDEDGLIMKPLNAIDKPLELYYEQIALRVAHSISNEGHECNKKHLNEFENMLINEEFVPAGRVLYGAGTNSETTFFNCFVMPFIQDSRKGLAKHREEVMEIMSRGGGVGTNGSTLRPRNALTRGVNGKSSGAVSWLHDLSELTNLVSQGGSRRGAQMIMMNDNHPDIVEFILSKVQRAEILQYIQKEIGHPLIDRLVSDKLSFTPLSGLEKEMYELITTTGHLGSASTELIEHAQNILHAGGTYSIENQEFLSGANISVAITDDFMKAVENDEEYHLKFPNIDNYNAKEMEEYNQEWHLIGDVREWERMGRRVKIHHTIKAKDLWRLINICATYSAEPGIFFIDNANAMTNSVAYDQKVVCSNPCGEQPLAPYSVCNLAAINLSKFANFGDLDFDRDRLQSVVASAVRFQDNVIDTTPYFLEANKQQAIGERRVGLGVMGLQDLLIKLGKTYGLKEGLKVVDDVFKLIAVTAYETSIEIAKEKGSFPFLIGENDEETLRKRKAFVNSGFMQNMPQHIRNNVLKYGIRNSHLLTVAPTGSIGTMMSCSTGLEPYFAFSYYRSGRLGANIKIDAPIVKEYYEFIGNASKKLPDYFISAMELTPEQHVETQCTIQRWVDSSISKTVNAPNGYHVNNVEKVYELLYKGKAKGGTVYVDGSRLSQVLSLTNNEEEVNQKQRESVDREIVYGSEVGNTCPICKEGEVVQAAGCTTCSVCQTQLKCES